MRVFVRGIGDFGQRCRSHLTLQRLFNEFINMESRIEVGEKSVSIGRSFPITISRGRTYETTRNLDLRYEIHSGAGAATYIHNPATDQLEHFPPMLEQQDVSQFVRQLLTDLANMYDRLREMSEDELRKELDGRKKFDKLQALLAPSS